MTLHRMPDPIQIPPHIRALLFDCDGTLVDTMPLHWQAELATLRELGIEVAPDWLAGNRGATMSDVIAAISRHTGRAIDAEAFIACKQVRFRELLPSTREITVVADLARAHFAMAAEPDRLRQSVANAQRLRRGFGSMSPSRRLPPIAA